MNIEAGPILFALILGVVLASGAAWVVSGMYRRRMLALMRGGPSPDDNRAASQTAPTATPVARPTPRLDPAANRRASLRYLLAMSVLCVLIGLTQSWLALLFVYADGPFSLNRLVVLGLVYAWPMVMAWGLLRRW